MEQNKLAWAGNKKSVKRKYSAFLVNDFCFFLKRKQGTGIKRSFVKVACEALYRQHSQ